MGIYVSNNEVSTPPPATGGRGVWTQGFMLAKWVLCHLSHSSSLFCLGHFGDSISFYAPAGLDHHPPILGFPLLLGWQAHAARLSFSVMRWGLKLFCPGLPVSRLNNNKDAEVTDHWLPGNWERRNSGHVCMKDNKRKSAMECVQCMCAHISLHCLDADNKLKNRSVNMSGTVLNIYSL
jgi:hypothetical protein